MLNLPPSSGDPFYQAPSHQAFQFFNTQSTVSKSLLVECGHNLDRSSAFVEPILDKAKHWMTSYYIQGITSRGATFLTTNLLNPEEAQITPIASNWLIGRSRNCAIILSDSSISRCHAVIGYHPTQGFYVMDVSSSNGTFLGGQRLPVMKRHPLKDGDLITLSHIQVEFFLVTEKIDERSTEG